MKHIKTVTKPVLQATLKTGGCGECQASCQSACKTSCTVGNQVCERQKKKFFQISNEKYPSNLTGFFYFRKILANLMS